MSNNTQFDLEQAIMGSWSTADDIQLALDAIYGEGELSVDEQMNLLIGIQALHQQRMEKVFRLFTKYIAER